MSAYLLSTGAIITATFVYWILQRYSWLYQDAKDLLYTLLPIAKEEKVMMKNGTTHIDLFEKHVATQPKKNFLLFEDKSFTYDVMNRRVNQIARAALQVDLSKGHTVAILMENCPEYLQLFFGMCIRTGPFFF